MSFYEKLNKAREEILSKDWQPDGIMATMGYKYLTEKKMKAQISSVLVKHGLNWSVQYKNLQVLPEIVSKSGQIQSHFVVTLQATISDGETTINLQAFGEGADTNDKAISKAQTNALKNLLANFFMVSSYDEDPEEKKFLTQEEKEEIKRKVVSEQLANVPDPKGDSPLHPSTSNTVSIVVTAPPTQQQKILIQSTHNNFVAKIQDQDLLVQEEEAYKTALSSKNKAQSYIDTFRPLVKQ